MATSTSSTPPPPLPPASAPSRVLPMYSPAEPATPPPTDSTASLSSSTDHESGSSTDFLAVPTPKRPASFAALLLTKFSSSYHGPVPEPCPSPVVNAPAGSTTHDATFFDPDNPAAQAVREKLALETLDEIIDWLHHGGGKVAIHDATNSTVQRRRALLDRVNREKGIKAMFIESICTDKRVLETNIQMKLQGPDYKNMPPEQAMRDFRARTANYEKAYQTISQEEEEQDDLGFIKLINVGKKIIAHNVHGYLESQCVFYLMQMHIKPRTIWLTRHGESEYNVSGRIGGDPPLTPLGRRFALALSKFIGTFHPPPDESPSTTTTTTSISTPSSVTAAPPSSSFPRSTSLLPDDTFGGTDATTSRPRSPLSIWTSTLQRTIETVQHFSPTEYDLKRIKFLNEIYAGVCENMTYAEIEQTHPAEFKLRADAKLVYRYPGPGGESYVDVIERLRPIIIELERMQTNVLIVTHQVVLRTLLSYFIGVPLDDMPTLSVPLHTLYCLKPKPYGADLVKYRFNPDTDAFDEIGCTL
ncbi:6-phosphofructo-2-kinase-domain-containing protein [Powellomyces hirtus]|nr:6-phosphofructo-2-kinase-domain-containing protein [Powellomyces hirtus]